MLFRSMIVLDPSFQPSPVLFRLPARWPMVFAMACLEAAVKILDALTHRKLGMRAPGGKFLEFSNAKIDSPEGRCYSPGDR